MDDLPLGSWENTSSHNAFPSATGKERPEKRDDPVPDVALLGLATAVPGHVLGQAEAAETAASLFGGRAGLSESLAGAFANAGIASRHIVRPTEWYHGDHGWGERNRVYVEAAEALYMEAARKALDAAGVRADEVDALVTVSTTGISTPSLEARVAGRMGFRPDAERIPVFGLGCAGGVSGLAIAARLARAAPARTVLFVTVELCSISIRLDKPSKANIIATALFGDGAAACVLRSAAPGKQIGGIAHIAGAGELLWPETLDIMGWSVEDPGLGVIFDRSIPPFVEEHMGEAVRRIAAASGIAPEDVTRFTCHPGGAKVIAALEGALALPEGSLDHERAVLRDCGNMSAPTVLFVLERLLSEGMPENTMLLALGPGFTASGMLLTRPE
jgi:alkylresorcinol/alkylpyrone synthase